jgi:hypothetical protein
MSSKHRAAHPAAVAFLFLAACSVAADKGVQGPAGAKGDVGAAGAQGAVGVAGPQGPQGPSGGPVGPAGPQGSVGPVGPQGTGAQGVQGPPGPQGLPGTASIVSSTVITRGPNVNGIPRLPRPDPTVVLCDGVSGMDFFAATVDVTLDSGQQILVSTVFDLGGFDTVHNVRGPASNLTVDICHQVVRGAGGPAEPILTLQTFLGDILGGIPLEVPAGARVPFTLVRTLELPALTVESGDKYTVGPCGCIDGDDDWRVGFSWLSVQVVKPGP